MDDISSFKGSKAAPQAEVYKPHYVKCPVPECTDGIFHRAPAQPRQCHCCNPSSLATLSALEIKHLRPGWASDLSIKRRNDALMYQGTEQHITNVDHERRRGLNNYGRQPAPF